MKRYDLRHLHADFYDRMMELIDEGLAEQEVGIFLFEIGDFSPIQKSADLIKESGHELMNSIKFNEVDWTIVVKKLDAATARERAEAYAKAKREAEEAAAKAQAEEEAKAKAAEEAKATQAQAAASAGAQSAPKTAAAEAKAATAAPKSDTDVAAKPAAGKTTEVSGNNEEKAKKTPKEAKKPTKQAGAETAKASKTDAKAKAEEKQPDTKDKVSKGDDLTVIKGIGKAYQEKLNNEGIYTIAEVAAMNDEQIQMMEEKYSFKGDFKESVADAKRLLQQKVD